jgi:predicted AAA+ superfamily ATPase
MIYPRKIQPKLEEFIDSPEAIVLTGMRRVGKTTLYRSIFDKIQSKNKIFLDMENPVTQKIFEEDNYDNVVSNFKEHGISLAEKAYIFLDEIQVMPEISKIVKYLYDHYQFKFFLTGSSSYYLKNLFPESLSGRKFVFELYPLDFEEFLAFNGQGKEFKSAFAQKNGEKNRLRYELLKGLYNEYLAFGGFPQVVLEADPVKKKMRIEDIFKSYFEKDVQGLAKFREINLFRDLLLLLMARTGSKLDISRVAAELGTSRETVSSYVAFLEGTYFIFRMDPFTNIDKTISKAKKIYFCDTGILNVFARIDEGAIFENAVFNNLRQKGKVCYYQRRSGREIDFVLSGETGLEVKLSGSDKDLKNLRELSGEIKLNEAYVITKDFIDKPGFIPAVDI